MNASLKLGECDFKIERKGGEIEPKKKERRKDKKKGSN
jgi:hypothetical protein